MSDNPPSGEPGKVHDRSTSPIIPSRTPPPRPSRPLNLCIEQDILEFLDGDPNWYSRYISQLHRLNLSSPRRPAHAALCRIDHDLESTPRANRTVSAPTGGALRDPVTHTIRRTFSQPAIRSFATSMQNRLKSRTPPPPLPIPAADAFIPNSEPPTPCCTTPQTPGFVAGVLRESPPMHERSRLAQEGDYHFCCRGEDDGSVLLDYRLSTSSGWAARLFASPECQSILTDPISPSSTSPDSSAYTGYLDGSPLRARSGSLSPPFFLESLTPPTVRKRKYPALWTDSLSLTSSPLLTPESPSPGSLDSDIEDSPLSPPGPVTPVSGIFAQVNLCPKKASDLMPVGLHLRVHKPKAWVHPFVVDGTTRAAF